MKTHDTRIAEALARTAAGVVAERLERLARNVRLRAAGFGGDNVETRLFTAKIVDEYHKTIAQTGIDLIHFVRAADDAQECIDTDVKRTSRSGS